MAFSWVQDVSVGASIDAADVNEIKTNLDSIYTSLGITRTGCASGAGWTKLPVSAGDAITSVQFQELRNVTDYAYDNKCPGYCSDEHTGYQSSHQAGVDSSHNTTYYSDQHTGYQSSYNYGVLGTYYATYYSDQHTGYYTSHQAGVDSSYNATVNSTYRSTVNTSYNETYLPP